MYRIGKALPVHIPDDLEASLKTALEGADVSMNELLVEGLVQLCKVKPTGLDAVEWLGRWLIENNPTKPCVEEPDDE